MKKQKSAFRCAMGFMLLVAGCSSGGGQNPGMTSGQADMAVGDNPDGGGDPSKDMSGQPPEDMAGMPPVDLAYTSGLPCTPGTYRCGAGLSVEICNATGTAWLYSATCTVGCMSGLCTGACTPSAKRCNAKNVETCNPTGSAWMVSETCSTFCEDARCALPSLDVGANKTLDGDQLIDGDVIIRSGATLSSPTGNLSIRTRGSITVEMGASIVVNPTGASPDGQGGCYYYYSSYNGAGGGGYGSNGTAGSGGYYGGAAWGSTTDINVSSGSMGGTSCGSYGGHPWGQGRRHAAPDGSQEHHHRRPGHGQR